MTKYYWMDSLYLHKVINLMNKARQPFKHLAIFFFSCFLAINFSVADPLSPYQAVYKTKIKGMSITAKREFNVGNDGIYQLSMDTKSMLVSVKERSSFTVKNQQIVSKQYRYDQTGIGKNRHNKLSFDWDKKIATDEGYKPAATIKTPDGTMDRLNSQLQIRLDLANKAKMDLPSYTVADKKRLKDYDFNILGEELLKTSLGNLNTVKIQRQRPNSERKTYIWYAKDWDYFLVKLTQIEDDGDKYELHLKEATINGEKIKGLK